MAGTGPIDAVYVIAACGIPLALIGLLLFVIIRITGAARGARKCPHCDQLNPAEARVCRRCGRALEPTATTSGQG